MRATIISCLILSATLVVVPVTAVPAAESEPVAGLQIMTPPLALPGLKRARTLRILLPADYQASDRRYPVIYMHDGQNLFDARTAYAGEWGVDETLAALTAESGFAAIVVGIDHGGPRRINELSPWPNADFGAGDGDLYLDDLVSRIKPFIDANYRTRIEPASTMMAGSSLGCLASLYAIHRRPEVFGKALVFSPSLWISEQVYMHVANVRLPAAARIYLYVGGAEDADGKALADLRMHELLRRRLPSAEQVTFSMVDNAGHNEAAWRAELPRALRWAFALDQQAESKATLP
ncbi:MAG: alpha/beta hydrolase [Pseudomarimonas sp.]